MPVRRQHIRRLVGDLIREHDLKGPPVPVQAIATAAGANVVMTPAEEGVSGFLLRRPRAEGIVIGVNASDAPARRLFTIAHELGHLLLHAGEELHVDRTATIYHRSLRSSEGIDEKEMEANLFAAELLMPFEFIQTDLNKIGHIDLENQEPLRELAKKYRVSPQAMSIRLAYLGWRTP